MTLFTRGKKAVTAEIPDDTPNSYKYYASKVHHISGDRMVRGWLLVACRAGMFVRQLLQLVYVHGALLAGL